ncbi:MAG TPA: N-acetylmuramoyl-L-alanine amidase family protein [bacterium]|nr:N-acetylmuramoyl-L-alanine amidase family protein [bacterium]
MKVVAAALLAVMTSGMMAGPAVGQTAGPRVVVNGVDVPLVAPAVVLNGQVLAPMPGLFDPMGAVSAFYETTQTIVVTNRLRTTVQLRLNDTIALVNGKTARLPAAPAQIGSHVFIPVQAVFALLGAWAKFDEAEGAVFVSSQITAITPQIVDGVLRVGVEATGPLQVETHVLRNPDRLVVDFLNAALRLSGREYPVNEAGVIRIRTGQFQSKPYISRVVFDLQQPVEIQVATAPNSYLVTLEVRQQGPGPADVAQPNVPQATPVAPGAGAVKIMGVSFQEDGSAGRLALETTGPMEFKIREFKFPDRLAIDLIGAVFVPVKQDVSVNGTSVVAVRAAQFTATPPVTRVVVTLKRKLNYVVSRSAGHLLVDLTTGSAQGHTVALDAGHGGRDPGAIGPTGLREAEVVLDVAQRVRDLLSQDGVRVLMIRDSDATVELDDRTRMAREGGATVYVSIHANASTRAAVNGTETYYLTPQSLALAQMIQDELGAVLSIPSRGIRTANFIVLRDNDVPSVLVETAYISHADDEARLRDQEFRQEIAEAVHRAIMRFLAVYPIPQGAP